MTSQILLSCEVYYIIDCSVKFDSGTLTPYNEGCVINPVRSLITGKALIPDFEPKEKDHYADKCCPIT